MFLEFIATIAIGFAAAGVFLLLNKLMRGVLPKWGMPALAGLAMLGYVVWSEYSWRPRIIATLPEGVEIASVNYTSAPWRPWTYAVPLANRMVAVDTRFTRRNPAHPDMVLTRVVLLGRWQTGAEVPVLYDCAGARRAEMTDAVAFDADGTPVGADWYPLSADDAALNVACAGG